MQYDDYKYNLKCYNIVDLSFECFSKRNLQISYMVLHYYRPSSSHKVTNLIKSLDERM